MNALKLSVIIPSFFITVMSCGDDVNDIGFILKFLVNRF